MDHINIPSFALLRYGTVIVRLKMEKNLEHFRERCHQADDRPEGVTGVVHRVCSCEHSTRTRLVSQCSDCDSALMGKCRTYRRRAAKSRYVNVCAAVCLLLLVGGLTPQSSAAPYRTRAMDRTRRASGLENESWSNPCDYDLSNMSSGDYKPELADKVANQVQYVLSGAKQLKEDIAILHSYSSFEKLLDQWKGTEWLRNHSWFREEVLPKSKEFGQLVKDKTVLEKLMASEDLDTVVLPTITKAMKMLGRGLNSVANSLWDNDPKERELKPKLNQLSNNIRYILCLTSDVLRARKVEMWPLYDSDVPTYTNHEAVTTDVFLIYRDTINFLEYMDDFFTVMTNTVLK